MTRLDATLIAVLGGLAASVLVALLWRATQPCRDYPATRLECDSDHVYTSRQGHDERGRETWTYWCECPEVPR